ncbi:MAG: RibD family protein, partial [Candidatus Carbobacillus sp.]|nr:RibD family protein [Candidatus Carbobacillus sp.]
VITREDTSMDAMHSLRRLGVDILTVPSSDVLSNETKWIVEATADVDHQAQDQQHQHDQNRNVNLQQALKLLSDRGVQSVLVEGGGNLNASLLQEGLVDEMLLFIAPKVIGGVAAKTPVEGSGLAQMGAAYPFEIMAVQRLGEDILIRTRLKH